MTHHPVYLENWIIGPTCMPKETYREDKMKYLNQQGELVSIPENDEKWLDDQFLEKEMAKLPDDAPRAALAYRVSTKGQVDHDDIPLQKIECRKFCVERGWRVVLEKLEKGVSGSKVSANKRDAIQELKAETQKKTFDILLVFMFDRLGRIENETPFVLEWFVKHGIQMWSTREGEQRLDSHVDHLLNYIRFWQAEGEVSKTSERVKARMKQLNSSGYYAGGTVPYGYRAVNKGRVNKKDQPVKDLEIEPTEALVVQEIFEAIANEGRSAHAMAQLLNGRELKTHRGTKFQCNNILRIVRHEGYTGYIITKNARSAYIPELEIVDKDLFDRANQVIAQRCAANAEARRVAGNSKNGTLLAGFIYCAHCGARLSGFMHKDRYRTADGTIVERMKPKYNCFQKSQRLRECDGQQLYQADIVDGIVLQIAKEMFDAIRCEPRDRAIEQRIRQVCNAQKSRKLTLEKKVMQMQYTLESYEKEVLKCIEGTSKFSAEMLNGLIKKAQVELQQAKMEYAQAVAECEDERTTLRTLKEYYKEFVGWGEEFELASLERKRMILSQLFSRVEVGRGYKVTVQVNMSYRQFLGLGAEGQQEAC